MKCPRRLGFALVVAAMVTASPLAAQQISKRNKPPTSSAS